MIYFKKIAGVDKMSNFNVQIDEELFNAAEIEGKANFRSTENQIKIFTAV